MEQGTPSAIERLCWAGLFAGMAGILLRLGVVALACALGAIDYSMNGLVWLDDRARLAAVVVPVVLAGLVGLRVSRRARGPGFRRWRRDLLEGLIWCSSLAGAGGLAAGWVFRSPGVGLSVGIVVWGLVWVHRRRVQQARRLLAKSAGAATPARPERRDELRAGR